MSVPIKYLNITCLVVDDQSTMRRTITNMLNRIGFKNILTAEDGKAALGLLEHAKVDLVICDINMPEMTGLELYKIIKANKKFSNLLFIFVTAEVKRNTVARAAEQGETAYIIKPFVLATLESKIEDVIKKRFEPSPFDQHQKRLQQYMDAMDLQSAEAELNKALEMWPDSPSVLFNLGQVSFRKGSTDKAIELYKRAIEKKPLFVKAYDALAKIYDDLGDTQSAIKYYELAHQISAANPDRLVTLSKLYTRTGESQKAEVMLKDAASDVILDESTSGHLLGEMYLAKNENEKALEVLMNARRKNPSDPSIMLSLADALRKNAKPEQAIEMYRELLNLRPNDADIHHAIGKTYLEMGNKAPAVEAITKAWELNPASKEITRDLRALAAKSKINL